MMTTPPLLRYNYAIQRQLRYNDNGIKIGTTTLYMYVMQPPVDKGKQLYIDRHERWEISWCDDGVYLEYTYQRSHIITTPPLHHQLLHSLAEWVFNNTMVDDDKEWVMNHLVSDERRDNDKSESWESENEKLAKTRSPALCVEIRRFCSAKFIVLKTLILYSWVYTI